MGNALSFSVKRSFGPSLNVYYFKLSPDCALHAEKLFPNTKDNEQNLIN